jgi:CBS domain-containing protein
MNILFFLIPKENVAYIYEDNTVRQGLEKLKHYGYTAVPILDNEGRYVGTITEGDFLRIILTYNNTNIKDYENIIIKDMEKKIHNKPVRVDSNMEDLLLTTINQSFVPVIDDRNVFMGIITRKDILQYYYNNVYKK